MFACLSPRWPSASPTSCDARAHGANRGVKGICPFFRLVERAAALWEWTTNDGETVVPFLRENRDERERSNYV